MCVYLCLCYHLISETTSSRYPDKLAMDISEVQYCCEDMAVFNSNNKYIFLYWDLLKDTSEVEKLARCPLDVPLWPI